MSAIIKFFQKKKLDMKFKKVGAGHRLNEESDKSTAACSGGGVGASYQSGPIRKEPTHESQRAGEAALIRFSQKNETTDPNVAMKVRMKREMETERKALENAQKTKTSTSGPQEVVQESAPVAASRILFKCPELGSVVLPHNEMEEYIREYLQNQLAEEPEMTSALMIHTFNKDKVKVKACVETISKYLDNIIANPEEEKYRKIRHSNKAFQERVSALEGTEEFIQAVGFQYKTISVDGVDEIFWVMEEEVAKDTERLKGLKEVLLLAEPIRPTLDRAAQVFRPSSAATKFDIPDEFYCVSKEELLKEQQRRQEAVEKYGMLRTKAMRERDEMKELRKYRYALIRVRMPDGILLQGTFKAFEKLSAIFEFVRENLTENWMPFHLVTQTGQRLTEDSSLAEFGLAPAAVVNLEWDKAVLKDIAAQQGELCQKQVLKPELMAFITTL
ncbi:hypothetical protein CHS0354_029707 [Potamilus streckersoni]|uniref:UBX domain-containing protein n=1 Tax=Potamilus streckersoni TaxID=2493646 RepID=A0AAE0RTM4_9BIVA|nr:hypothetical protein CHS0354_029707 [Potamilus streckersoni]